MICLCENCFPDGNKYEAYCIIPGSSCIECGAHDNRFGTGLVVHAFPDDPREEEEMSVTRKCKVCGKSVPWKNIDCLANKVGVFCYYESVHGGDFFQWKNSKTYFTGFICDSCMNKLTKDETLEILEEKRWPSVGYSKFQQWHDPWDSSYEETYEVIKKHEPIRINGIVKVLASMKGCTEYQINDSTVGAHISNLSQNGFIEKVPEKRRKPYIRKTNQGPALWRVKRRKK